jgi:NAD+ synthase
MGRHRVGIALRQDMTGSSLPPLHYLTVQDENGVMLLEERIRLQDYMELVAATNFKQRSRAVQLYYFADQYNYAVLGTTNRDELLLGFFVKLGDGAADVEGIEGLYKSELYVLAKAMGVDQRVIDRTPTTDTLPGQGSQRGYFYGLDFITLDTGLQVLEGLMTVAKAAELTGLQESQVKQLVDNLKRRNETTTILRAPPTGIGRAPLAPYL